MADEKSSGTGKDPPKPSLGTFFTVFMFTLTIFILFDWGGMRESFGSIIDALLGPTIGTIANPLLVLLVLGTFVSVANTVIRTLMTDPVEQARIQRITKDLNKELSEARKAENKYKLKKLMDYQQEFMSRSMKVQFAMMKPMIYTMFIIILLFAWLGTYIDSSSVQNYAIPWDLDVSLQGRWWIMPHWVLLYAMFSAPYAFLVNRVMKHFLFIRRLKQLEEGEPA